jgi:hypothetical protein
VETGLIKLEVLSRTAVKSTKRQDDQPGSGMACVLRDTVRRTGPSVRPCVCSPLT